MRQGVHHPRTGSVGGLCAAPLGRHGVEWPLPRRASNQESGRITLLSGASRSAPPRCGAANSGWRPDRTAAATQRDTELLILDALLDPRPLAVMVLHPGRRSIEVGEDEAVAVDGI